MSSNTKSNEKILLFSFILFGTDCQQRYEAELLQLREKLHSLSNEQDESCQLKQESDQPHSGNDLQENGGYNSDVQSSESSESSERLEQKFHDILNRELLIFCDRMFTSKTGDVSNEQEANGRHDVVETCENHSGKSGDNLGTDGKEPDQHFDVADNSQEFGKEIEKLKRKLIEVLTPLLSSDDGKNIYLYYPFFFSQNRIEKFTILPFIAEIF